MRTAKIIIFILAAIVAIETAHIVSLYHMLIPEYEATVQELRDYLNEAWEREKFLGNSLSEQFKKEEAPNEMDIQPVRTDAPANVV
jgi:hypothetical protein